MRPNNYVSDRRRAEARAKPPRPKKNSSLNRQQVDDEGGEGGGKEEEEKEREEESPSSLLLLLMESDKKFKAKFDSQRTNLANINYNRKTIISSAISFHLIVLLAVITMANVLTHSLEIIATNEDALTAVASSDNRSSSLATNKSSANNFDAYKVAALASKLEHWFTCHRLSLMGPLPAAGSQMNQATASGESGQPKGDQLMGDDRGGAADNLPGCGAHFDGHLCWPNARANQLVELPCPRLNWLPSELRSVNSVINSIQSTTTTTTQATIVTATIPTATTTSQNIRPDVANTGKAKIRGKAYRKCLAHEKQTHSGWQQEADYSHCRSTSADSSLDPLNDERIKLDQEPDKRLFATLVDELERIEATIDPYSDPDLLEQWTLCIGNIMHHQQKRNDHNSNQSAPEISCPIIFDGWRCWPATRAGETAYVSCPSNQPGFSMERKAHKICTSNGTWYKHPMTNRYWSNYTTCVDTVDLAFRTKILNLYVIGNLISLIALAASLIIFISFKSLNCTRVTIHKNLFLSFITNNLMWIIWYTYVVNDADLLQSNPGLYLHTLLVVAFVSEDKILKWFYLLGWLIPVPITVAYAYNRSYDDYYTHFCWMEESPHNLILMLPIGISLLLNLIFLINIVRVLLTKLRANNSPDTHQTRKAVRATLILIPLLGLHYMLTPFRPEAKSEWEVIYEIIAAVCTSFQGLCVAMLFCFCNGEVIAAIKKKLKDTFGLGKSHNYPHQDQMRSRCNTTTTTITANIHPGARHMSFQCSPSQSQPIIDGCASSGQTMRSVILSSSSNGDLIHPTSLPLPISYSPINGTNGTTGSSNSSSLLTTITASSVQTAAIHPTDVLLCETNLQDNLIPLIAPSIINNNNNTKNGNVGQDLSQQLSETVNLLLEHKQANGNATISQA